MSTSLSIANEEPAGAPPSSLCLGIGMTVTMERGRTILVEGDPANQFYRILSGTVRLYSSIADGRRQVIDFLAEGEVFGLTGGGAHPYSVEAVTPVTLVRYPRSIVEAAIDRDPEVARDLFALACSELQRAQRQMLLLGRKTADERVASFLLRLAEGDDPRPLVTLPMSRQDIGDHLGLTIETVSRTISRFRRAGLISLVGRQQIRLERVDRLHALGKDAIEAHVGSCDAMAPLAGLRDGRHART
jgi:CRP/FNR family transcriptional regulator